MINVTSPYLPPLEDLIPYLEKIWESKILTNDGPMHEQLELEMKSFFDVQNLSLVNNGTSALLVALKALGLDGGEIITTPFTFVATSSAIISSGFKIIFVDIDENTFNINPEKIEEAITDKTVAILPVHCYGRPCDVDAIDQIAKKYNLKVIYDAAHAFGVKYKGRSLMSYGDMSTLSFHATKIFNTFEGGAVVSKSIATKNTISKLKNFGIDNEVHVSLVGLNSKMSEFNAALGIVQLKHISELIYLRSKIDLKYRSEMCDIQGIVFPSSIDHAEPNYSYFPILIDQSYKLSRDELHEALKQRGFYSRRYFYPLISSFPPFKDSRMVVSHDLTNANNVAKQILCLPIFPGLQDEHIKSICRIILELSK